jgi:glycosyltransferase involved in cell wall biosynthesis
MPDDEVIIVDDGSTDDSAQIIHALNDARIRYIRHASNRGAGAARNTGTRAACGDLIAYLDSDDEWLPGKALLQRRFLEARPDVLFCFTDLGRDFDGKRHALSHGNLWHTDPRRWDEILSPPISYSTVAELPPDVDDFNVYIGDLYRGEMHTNYLSTICVMIRRFDAADAIHFCENVATFEDWECLGRLTGRGQGAFLDFLGALQHKHPGPRVTDADWVARAESRLAVLRSVWGSDPKFLARHGREYQDLIAEQQISKIRGLIVLGRMREARAEMRQLNRVPVLYRAASRIPGEVMSKLVALRHVFQRNQA